MKEKRERNDRRIGFAKAKRIMVKAIPYVVFGLFSTNIGEAVRLSEGQDAASRLLSFFQKIPEAFQNPLPSFAPLDLLLGVLAAGLLWIIVYLKNQNRKRFRPKEEYGSARWGTSKDIAPFMDPVFSENVILTKTERLTMASRPKDPSKARNKNVLVVGGSGSGKTRFFIKPNILQYHSSYVVTDPNRTNNKDNKCEVFF